MTRRRGFTLIELLVVIAIIAILAAILFPVFAQARDSARASACLSNVKQLGTAIHMYTQDYDETLPHHAGDFFNFMLPTVGANWPRNVQPYVKNDKVFACPSSSIASGHNPALPRNSYQGNGVVLSRLGTTLARIPNPADIIFCQENFFAWSTAWNRPTQTNAATAATAQYRYWHLVDCRPQFSGPPVVMTQGGATCAEQYNSRHFEGGNLVFVDGHAKFRKFRSIRSGEFGLVPDEPYRADTVQAHCSPGCGGRVYTAAF